MINKKAILAGFVSGIAAPLFTLFLIYVVKFGQHDLGEFIKVAIQQQVISALIALSLLSNLALFFLFLWRQKEWASRGVLLATLVFGFLIIYFKFLA